MESLIFILYAILLGALIFKWEFFEFKGVKRTYLVAVFALKLMAGFGLAQLYTDHYTHRRTGDAFRFYDDARILHSSFEDSPRTYLKLMTGIGLKDDPAAMTYYYRMTHMERAYYTGFINDNATIIRFNAFLMLFSMGSYHVHTAFSCFIAMIGLTALFRLFYTYFPRKKWAMFFAVYLLPTVVFWGSGVLKEPILLLGMGVFLLGYFRFIYGNANWKDGIMISCGFFILLITKGYVLQCMAPALLGLILVKRSGGRRFWLWFSIPHLAAVLLIWIGPMVSDGLKIAELIGLKQTAFYNIADLSHAGSVIEIRRVEEPIDVFTAAPEALANIYLRPWPWQWKKAVFIPAALENSLMLLCLFIMLWNYKRPPGLSLPILAFAGSFVLILGVVSGETVPILGALVRYKLPALIFIFVLIFAAIDHSLLQRRFPIIRKLVRKL